MIVDDDWVVVGIIIFNLEDEEGYKTTEFCREQSLGTSLFVVGE